MYDLQWFLMGHPVDEKDIQIEYKAEIDNRGTKSVPYLIRSQLEEIEVLEYEIATLQANALKRMDMLQEKIERHERTMSAMAREIRRLKKKAGEDDEQINSKS